MKSKFKKYVRTNVAEMRPHIVGEDSTIFSVNQEDQGNVELPGGMIARNPDNHKDQWYINEDYFKKNFKEL